MASKLRQVVEQAAKDQVSPPKLIPGQASEISIERADDNSGYTVHTRHREGKNHEYHPSHKSVHKSLASVHKHAKLAFEGNKDVEDNDDGSENES